MIEHSHDFPCKYENLSFLEDACLQAYQGEIYMPALTIVPVGSGTWKFIQTVLIRAGICSTALPCYKFIETTARYPMDISIDW